MKNPVPNIPIIFVHKGIQFYLKNAIRHAVVYNPNNQIFLVGDDRNTSIKKLEYKQVQHFLIDDYFGLAGEFASKYIHLSTNQYNYELFCFQRWFIIKEFMVKNKIDMCLCLDTDVLLYCDVSKEFQPFLKYDFTICRRSLPCATLMKLDSIKRFTDYIASLYSDEYNIDRLKRINRECFDKNGKRIRMGGVSDMTAFDLYQKDISNNVFDLIYPFDNKSFDGKFNISDGFKVKDGVKEIFWENDLPYGKYGEKEEMVRFLGLHFQGRSKMKQHKYLVDDLGKHIEKIGFSIRWIMIKASLSKYISGMKKIRHMLIFFWNTYNVRNRSH